MISFKPSRRNQWLQNLFKNFGYSPLEQAKFEMNCPSANATVLSQDFIQPAIQGPWVAGLERVEYTVGVEGCNQRKVYIILCQVGSDTCFAASPDTRFRS